MSCLLAALPRGRYTGAHEGAAAWAAGGGVNYAATLAVLAVLAFFFPLGVRLTRELGVPSTLSDSAFGALGVLALATLLIRWRVAWFRSLSARAQTGREQVGAAPLEPEAYHVDGEHLGLILLKLGRRREAERVIEGYAALPGVPPEEVLELRARLAAYLKRARREASQNPLQDTR